MSNHAAFRPSPQQERLWAVHPDGPAGRTQAVVALSGALDPEALRAGLGRIAERHEILRTTFARRPGIRIPLQVVHDELPPAFATSDLSSLEPAAREARVAELAREDRHAALDLEHGPLLGVRHAVLGPERHVLVVTASALCLDAATVPTLLAEIAARTGADVKPADEPLQYADYAEWQHELAGSEDDDAVAGRRYWAECEGLRSAGPPFAGAASAEAAAGPVEVPYDAALAAAVLELARRYGATPEAVVHAGWHALLARLTGTEEVVTVLVDGGPGRDPLDGLIGPTARAVPVRTPVAADATFAELIARLHRTRSEALAWEDYAPASGDDGLRVGFASCTGFQADGAAVRLQLETVAAAPGPGLWLIAHDLAGAPRVQIAGDCAQDAAERLADQLGRLLRSAASEPGTATGRLEVLSPGERRRVLADFSDTRTEGGAPSVQERFAAHALARPDAVAVEDGVTSITYGELAARAGRLARHLGRLGVEPGAVVGLCTDRSVDMAIGLLGILNAGAGFLPLHFEHPRARLAHQLTEAGCRVLVTQPGLRSRLPDAGLEIVSLDADALAVESAGAEPPPAVRAEDLAYVIYTSGSTGRPKGVGVTNANLANYVDHLVRRLDAQAQPLSFAMVTALSTDLGHTAVFGALGSGGTLTLVAPAEAADAASLARRLDRTPVDVMKITPSHLGALLAGGDARVLPRGTLVVGGERLGWDLVERVRKLGGCAVLNHYGPTETTVGSCMSTVPDGPGPMAPASVPIGRPIANTRCYVLDAWREPAAIGAPGALFIAGAGVARGYVGQPELTAERFSPDPFMADGGSMYDTGDRARWLPDGTLEHLGRADEQVKIRGFRVEPGEVEEALRAHPGVREAVVVARDDVNGSPRLVAYAAHEPAVSQDELAAHLAELVPDYMVPGVFVSLDALPLTPSGKVDRRALPEPAEPGGAGGAGWVGPRTPLEQAVAAIWSAVLGVERVGVQDDFFALGGHSLLAAQVVAQVRSDFAVELPMHSLFTMPTVASLSEEIGRLMGSVDEGETARLLAKLEHLSDEEVERLLSEHASLDEG